MVIYTISTFICLSDGRYKLCMQTIDYVCCEAFACAGLEWTSFNKSLSRLLLKWFIVQLPGYISLTLDRCKTTNPPVSCENQESYLQAREPYCKTYFAWLQGACRLLLVRKVLGCFVLFHIAERQAVGHVQTAPLN